MFFVGSGYFSLKYFNQTLDQDSGSLVAVQRWSARVEFLRKISDDYPLTPLMHPCLSTSPGSLCPNAADIHEEQARIKVYFKK